MASTYLSRTPSSAGNRAVWTWSAWIKINGLNGNEALFNAGGWSAGQDGTGIVLYNGSIYTYWNSPSNPTTTSRLFRDPSAWYHVVLQANTSTLKVYINGSEVSSKSISGNGAINNTTANTIGRYSDNAGGFFNGYMSEVHFTDGTAYAASTFGETDTSGVWTPKVGPTVTYGTNGFYLKFANSGAMGTDSSGQSNTLALGGGTLRQVTDSPTNVFATFNSIFKRTSVDPTFSQGNCKIVQTASNGIAYSTIGASSGKWYAEIKVDDVGTATSCGILEPSAYDNGNPDTQAIYYQSNGNKNNKGSASSYGASYTTGDIIGIALDVDNGTLAFYKNGASQGTAFTGLDTNTTWLIGCHGYGGSGSQSANFGNPTFTIASGNADGNSKGNFEYAPPTGYLALCTDNLSSALTIPVNKGTDNFNTVLYTGTGSAASITGVGFRPDWLWIKARNSGQNNVLFDSVRGSDKQLMSNVTDAETTNTTNKISTFDSDGFSIVGDVGTLNGNGNTFAAWNWKAGSTAPANTYAVKVVSDSGNKYRFDDYGTSAITLELQEGGTFTFDQSDASNSGHPLRFSSTADGTHGGGSEYTTGVTTTGTPGQAGAKTVIVVAGSAPTLYYYCSVHSGMGGQANTGSLFGFTNVKGSIQSVVSPNSTAGFNIVSYTGTGSVATIGHGLGAVPQMYIVKNRIITQPWWTFHEALGGAGNLRLNESAGDYSDSSVWNDTAPTSSVFTVGTNTGSNGSGNTIIAYCFTEVEGYSKFDSYTGNANADGPFVYTGFRPAYILRKYADGGEQWIIQDTPRTPDNVNETYLYPAQTNTETSASQMSMDILSNGFKMRATDGATNGSGRRYIYMAFASNPFVSSGGTPVTAR